MTLKLLLNRTAKVGECMEWQMSLDTHGYGQIGLQGKIKLAHRVAWELSNGPIPAGLFVCHLCDNRRCINPDHLFLGTNQDNINDSLAKNRFLQNRQHGEDHANAKLSNADVEFIRATGDGRKGGIPASTLAKQFSVYVGTIYKIRQNRKRTKC